MTRELDDETKVQRGSGEAEDRGFEEQDAALRPIVIAMLGFGALMLAGLAFPALFLGLAGREAAPSALDAMRSEAPTPSPRLLADPRAERLRLEASQQRALQAGPTPIDRRMRDIAKQGWDAGQ